MSGINSGSGLRGVTGTYSQDDYFTKSSERIHFEFWRYFVQALYVARMSAPGFRALGDDPASQKPGWGAVTTEPYACNDWTPPHTPMSRTETANKGEYFSGIYLPLSLMRYLMSQTQLVLLLVSRFFCFCFEATHSVSISLTSLIHDLCCRFVHICVF